MNKLTPALAVAAAVLFASASPAAFAQTNLPKPGTGASESSASSYSPPIDEHKKRPKKPKKSKKTEGAASTPAS
jgi:hypothetical protein